MTALRGPLVLLAFLMSAACASTPLAPGDPMPGWLTTLTNQFEARPAANPPSTIALYDYKGQSVYFVPQQCCDIMSVLYSAGGSVICHPDGGFAGSGDGKCADFLAERKNERIVWRDTRTVSK